MPRPEGDREPRARQRSSPSSPTTRCARSRAPHNGAWMRPAEPRPVDPVLLAALTDAWIPAAFAHMDQPTFVPTIDLTIHWRAAPGVPAGEHPWVLGAVHDGARRGRHVGGGRRSCGARTASCSRSPASSRSSATRGDRPPRARLQRRRPPRAPAGRGRRAAGARRARAGLLFGLRHRAGRRGARPAGVPQRGRARGDRARAGGAARCVQGGRARARDGRRVACGTGRGRSTWTCCCWGTWRGSRSG